MAHLEELDDEMGGLYQKATDILTTTHTGSDTDSGSIMFDEKSGISKQDQKDIIENINQIMQSNKIRVSPELFRIKAKKRGFGFPFLVNLFGLVFLAVGVFILWFLFQQEETSIANPSTAVSITDQGIIDKLKQDAQRKNQEIQDIQSNLEKVNSDLTRLQENIDAEVAAKEEQLRSELNAELEAEREKLLAAGASAAEVESRMQALQAEQEARFQAEQERIARQAEEDRRRQEQSLLDQRSVYFTQLENARNELRRTEEEYQAKVAEQEKTISEAEKRIQALSAQKEKFDLVNDQIIGYYRVIQTNIASGDFATAREKLEELRAYLSQPAVTSVPEINRRKDVELFVIESLTALITNAEQTRSGNARTVSAESRESGANAREVGAEAATITRIRELVLQADEAYRSGNKTRADALYLEALELIPEINRSHTYFMNKVAEIETFRKTQLNSLLETAAGQFRNKQYAEALTTYGRVLDYLPTDRDTERVLTEIRNAGAELAAARTRNSAEDERQAQRKLSDADARLEAGAWDEAIRGYLDLLRTYPATPQAQTATRQLEKAIAKKDETFSQQVVGIQNNTSGDLAAYQKEIAVLKNTLAEREKELAALKGSTGDLEKSRLEEAARREAAEKMAADYRALQEGYGRYTRQEDGVIRRGTLEEMALGKSYLDSFLSSSTVQSAFPGLLERIKRYDRAFELAGRNSALQDTIAILQAANGFRTRAERIAYLQKKLNEVKSDELTTVMIRSLISLISS